MPINAPCRIGVVCPEAGAARPIGRASTRQSSSPKATTGSANPAPDTWTGFSFQVAEAADGEQALKQITAEPPQVILAELNLP